MRRSGRLTELESCALADIWRMQPCSTYDIRQNFARSPSSSWSDSAGSIYPVIARLIKLKLVQTRKRRGDARGRRDLSVTAAGLQSIQSWISNLEPWTGQATADPIRTRAHFLASLPTTKACDDFLNLAEALTADAISHVSVYAETERITSHIAYMVGVGALRELEARKAWLAEL